MTNMLMENLTDPSAEFAFDMLAKWREALHPRDSHGRFRDKWKLSGGAKNLIDRILKTVHPLTARDDDHFQTYADIQAHKKKRSPETAASIEYLTTKNGWDDIQSSLRAGASRQHPQIRHIDQAMAPTEDDLLLTRVMGADAFGLPPERIGEIEEWTSKLVSDKGYGSTNLGTQYPTEGPHITMSILVPRGTKAIFPGGSREVILQRDQPIRIMKVEPDGKGGVNVYAIAEPMHAPGRGPARNLGAELPVRERAPAIAPHPEEMARRGLGPDGNPLPPPVAAPAPGAPPAAAPAAPAAPQAGVPLAARKPLTPAGAPGADVHAGREQVARDRIAADQAAGREPAKKDVQAAEHHARLAEVEGKKKEIAAAQDEQRRVKAEAEHQARMDKLGARLDRLEGKATPKPPPRPQPKTNKDRARVPELDEKVAARAKARERHQEIAARQPVAKAMASLDELNDKKASNKVMAEHVRAHAMGPDMDEIRDPEKRAQISRELETIAQDLDKGQRVKAMKGMAALEKKYHITRHGQAGDLVDFDPNLHEGEGDLKPGDKVRVLRPGASVLHEDNSRTQLHRALVRPSVGGTKERSLPAKRVAKKAVPAKRVRAPKAKPEANPDGRDKMLVADLRKQAEDRDLDIKGDKKADILRKLRENDANPELHKKGPEQPKVPKKRAPRAAVKKATPPRKTLPEDQRPDIPEAIDKVRAPELRKMAEAHGIKTRDENGKMRPVAELRKDLRAERNRRQDKAMEQNVRRIVAEHDRKKAEGGSLPDTAKMRAAQLKRDQGKGGTVPGRAGVQAAQKEPIPLGLVRMPVKDVRALAVNHGIDIRDGNGKLRPVADLRADLRKARMKQNAKALQVGPLPVPNIPPPRIPTAVKKAMPAATPPRVKGDELAILPIGVLRKLAADNGIPIRDHNNKLIKLDDLRAQMRLKGVFRRATPPPAPDIPQAWDLRRMKPKELRDLANAHGVDIRFPDGKLLDKDRLVRALNQKARDIDQKKRGVNAPGGWNAGQPKAPKRMIRVPNGRMNVNGRDVRVGDDVEWLPNGPVGLARAGKVERLGQNAIVLDNGQRIPYGDVNIHLIAREEGNLMPKGPRIGADWELRKMLVADLRELGRRHGHDLKGLRKPEVIMNLGILRDKLLAARGNGLASFGGPAALRRHELEVKKLDELQKLAEDNGVPWEGKDRDYLIDKLVGVFPLRQSELPGKQSGFAPLDLKVLRQMAADEGIHLARHEHRDVIIKKLKALGVDDPTVPLEGLNVHQLKRRIDRADLLPLPGNPTKEELIAYLRNPPAQMFHHSPDQGVLDLQARVGKGVKKLNPINEGAMGETAKAELEDGSEALRKGHRDMWGMTAKRQADGEQLASLIARDVLDIKGAPPVWRQNLRTIFMGFIHGKTASRAARDAREKALKSEEGRKMGLLDAIIFNTDRHDGNWMIDVHGRPAPIDHGLTWGHIEAGGRGRLRRDAAGDVRPIAGGNTSPFMTFWLTDFGGGGWKDKVPYTTTELDEVRRKLEALRQQFVMLGREDWLEDSLATIATLRKRAKHAPPKGQAQIPGLQLPPRHGIAPHQPAIRVAAPPRKRAAPRAPHLP